MLGQLFRVARVQFLGFGFALFLFGALWAILLGASPSIEQLLSGYLILALAQLSIHFSNDFFDATTDQLGGATLISGGSGVLQTLPELRGVVRWIAVALIVLSLGVGIAFIQAYAFPIWMLGFILLGNLVGWVYSAPPLRLCARGLGEIATAFSVGFLIPTMGYWVARGKLDWDGIFFLIPLLLYGLVMILAVEIPDMEGDRRAYKMNWVARWGRGFAYTAIGWLLIAATGYFFLASWFAVPTLPLNLNILGFLSLLPLGMGLIGMLKRPHERAPSIQIATGIILSLVAFAIVADGYLLYQALL